MKKIESVTKELSALRQMLKEAADKNKEEGKKVRSNAWQKARIILLDQVRLYLETGPTEEYLLREEARLTTLLENINARFDEWVDLNKDRMHQKKLKAAFKSEMDIAKYTKQLKIIHFLLQAE